MLTDILAEDHYNYQRQNGETTAVSLQIGVPLQTEIGAGVCRSAIFGIEGAEFECVAGDTFGALCGAIRLMKEWVAERYTLGDCLCWIAEDNSPDDENSGPVPLWLLFSCRSQMTEADRVAYDKVSAELSDAEQPVETEASRRDHDEHKAHLFKISDIPITNVAATVRYYSLTPKGQQIPSEIILERPYIHHEGNPVVRFTMTTWYDKPYPFSGYSTFSALISVLRFGWYLLDNGCKLHNASLYRDPDGIHQTNPSEIYHFLFQLGD